MVQGSRFKVLLILLAFSLTALSQENDSTRNVKRNVSIVMGTEAALYAGSMSGLYFLWYAGYEQSPFHFFNDNAEWLQMDKAGHATSAYHVGLIGYEALRLAGLDEKKSLLYGAPLGFMFLSTVEIFDGLSAGWGFSWGDMAANALGAGLFMGQQALWHEQRIAMKYSYHNTQFPQYRPNLLGSNLPERMLKDYNGQTIWLSFNLKSLFLGKESKFPSWINLAFGYSAEGMTGGFSNVNQYNGQAIPEFTRTRQFILSPDIDLTRIPVENKFLKTTLKVLSFIKIPMPAIMLDSQGDFSAYWLYF
jgi:uncharacterized protein YfiM (DUF2279 family)